MVNVIDILWNSITYIITHKPLLKQAKNSITNTSKHSSCIAGVFSLKQYLSQIYEFEMTQSRDHQKSGLFPIRSVAFIGRYSFSFMFLVQHRGRYQIVQHL